MLKITVPLSESFNEATSEFVIEGFDLELEHSLVSLSKWEANFERPFLNTNEKSAGETLFYIEHCMTLTKNPPGEIFQKLSEKNFLEIQTYIDAKRSATWFGNNKQNLPQTRQSQQVVTSAVIYGWMVALRIPFETQYWHLNELFTLINVCNEQARPAKKMSRAEAARQQAALNAQRRAEMGTRG